MVKTKTNSVEVETPVEETPVEETPVEETPVEETPVEETPDRGSPERGSPEMVGSTVRSCPFCERTDCCFMTKSK